MSMRYFNEETSRIPFKPKSDSSSWTTLFGQGEAPDASLLEKGLIDSTGVLELVAFVSRKYEIVVEDEELVPANFDSVDNLAAYLERKVGHGE
jgi:acyl carrier protein